MLLMKDRSFLYELRAYLIYVKVGEYPFLELSEIFLSRPGIAAKALKALKSVSK